ncbi:TPA: glycosyltransferase [Stenotrophomonas maltophilia]|uniref:glycosyltransferase family 2 protein n=1 Tax=Stenotrophomonas TaxID=40323 RepID=UPI0013DB0EDE|nr:MULTISPECIES: glycosyltransferase family 2 protein [Stenotrophomonas]MBH1590926.1 glycosyltransferase [Stenotrophomonas maltophilia]MDH2021653.1 glycosyltransferase family 2 protein [Stenotrophomonas sp. GD03680]HEL3748104.1 glycosyltransferase [Stenotrophomonas maltophilia]HEL7728918.1 glycosyltransferase [Stenotrophomonas maltophilia]
MTRRIFLSTPLRNEIDNIPDLYAAVAAQDTAIAMWVIVENGSTDGSRELLQTLAKPANVEQLIVLNEDTESGEYALGQKYARIVSRGFDEIRGSVELGNEDLIGILDADSFPEPDYYRLLIEAFDRNPKLGIASGISRDTGTDRRSMHAADWVRGSCRLWRGACMVQSGYIIGPSADTLSLARAEIDGWEARVVKEATFEAREVGARSKQRYYGGSAHFRGNTLTYALVRFGKFVMHGRFADARDYLGGYWSARASGSPQIDDSEIRAYFHGYLSRKLKQRLGLTAH